MKKISITAALALGISTVMIAQEKPWTLDECMRYAIENSPKVKIKKYESANEKLNVVEAIGSVMPAVSGQAQASWGYGRNINADNIYENINTFSNNYSMGAEIPVFAGGYYFNNWKMAVENRLLGKSNEQLEKDNTAMKVMNDYIDVVYYKGMIELAAEKLGESSSTFYKTQRMVELGMKSVADLAQTEALMAEDDYNLTFYTNQYNNALLKLKQDMFFPVEEELQVEDIQNEEEYLPEPESPVLIFEYARLNNPQALSAEYSLKSSRYNYRRVRGNMMPNISFWGSASTRYYDILSSDENSKSFKSQFNDNLGKSFGFTVSIPIVSVSRYTNARKARNNVRIAAEQQKETLREIQNVIEKNVMDREGYAKEIVQMEKQVNANDLAYYLTLRQYEEGLKSPIDVQTNSNTLLSSKATLLQKRLLYIITDRIVDYYKGIPLVQE